MYLLILSASHTGSIGYKGMAPSKCFINGPTFNSLIPSIVSPLLPRLISRTPILHSSRIFVHPLFPILCNDWFYCIFHNFYLHWWNNLINHYANAFLGVWMLSNLSIIALYYRQNLQKNFLNNGYDGGNGSSIEDNMKESWE